MAMTQTVWLAVGAAAALVSVGSIGLRRPTRGQSKLVVQLIGSSFGAFLWALFAINAFNYEVVTETGTTVGQSTPSLGYLALPLAVLLLLDVILTTLSALGVDWGRQMQGVGR